MIFLGLVAAIAAVAAGVAAVAGFGIGSLLTPVVALEFGMKTAVAAVAIPHVTATLLRFWKLRAHVDRKILFSFGWMNAAGSLAGALLHTRIESRFLALLLGALLVFAGCIGVLGYADRMRFGRSTAWVAGIVSGAFGGLVGNQGGIRSAAMLGLRIEGPPFVATAAAIALMVDAVRMPVYFVSEWPEIRRAEPAVLAGLIGVVIGTLGGERILRSIPKHIFRRIVAGILLAVGAYLLAMPAAG